MASHHPQFICIGEQRCGTTWLHSALRGHPDLWLPPIKSTQYFIRQSDASLMTLILSGQEPGQARRLRQIGRKWRKHISDGGAANLAWFARFYLRKRNDDWYRGLFGAAGGRMAGEICHAYSSMTPAQLEKMRAGFPHLKIIYMMRDPIDRAWSGLARARARTGKTIEPGWSWDRLQDELEQAKAAEKSDYMQTVSQFMHTFGPDQFYAGTFEQLRDEPAAFLSGLARWLGIAEFAEQAIPSPPRSQGAYPPIPRVAEQWLACRLENSAQELCDLLPDPYRQAWAKRISGIRV